MQTALFTFRRRVLVNGEEKFNDNFINPLNVTSFFWETNQDGKAILNVFLNAVRATNNGTNAYSITFGQSVGEKFVSHMEEFLRYQLGWGRTEPTPTSTGRNERHPRKAIEVIEEVADGPAAEWAAT